MKPWTSNPFAQDAPTEQLLCRILRDDSPDWPALDGAGFAQHFVELCREEGVAPLVWHHAAPTPAWPAWPVAVRQALARDARMHTAEDMLREQELIAVLEAFAAAGIDAVLLKGTPLAYSHYAAPGLRARCDTDLLIEPGAKDAVARLLESLGYQRPNAFSGSLVSYADSYCKMDGSVGHVLDVHWRINNAQLFAQALSWEDARGCAVPVPALGRAARGLYPPHALLLACMHRAAHLGADGEHGNRLIWLYDIHLLANAMRADEWREFAQLCVAKQMRALTLDAFACTHASLNTMFPADVLEQLATPKTRELSVAYLDASRKRLLLVDLRALGTWRERLTLLRESCFPPADYVMAKYQARNRSWLSWWYVRRAVEGVWKLVRF